MAMYAVESKRQEMIATGIVEPVMEWVDTPEGRRRPSDRQARNEDTGMPLWAVEVLYKLVSFGRESSVTAKVTVGAEYQPVPDRLGPVQFERLQVEARINKAGGLSEVWSAEAMADTAAPTKPTAASSVAGKQPSASGSSAAA